MEQLDSATPVVLFDGTCGFCTWCVHIAQTRIGATAHYLPYQSADLAVLGVSKQAAERSVQFIHQGEALGSSEAVKAILRLGNRPYPVLAWLMDLPGIRRIVERGYWFVAKHRGKLPGLKPPL